MPPLFTKKKDARFFERTKEMEVTSGSIMQTKPDIFPLSFCLHRSALHRLPFTVHPVRTAFGLPGVSNPARSFFGTHNLNIITWLRNNYFKRLLW